MIHSRQQARKLFLTLFCIELLFVVAYATDAWVQGPDQQMHPLIDLDGEGNLPTWFSSFQLTVIAISFWTLASRAKPNDRPSRRFLRTCGGFFLLLSIDETAMLHERITATVGSRYIDWVPAYLTNHIGDAIVCVLVLVACFSAAYPHLRGLWLSSRSACLFAVAGGAVYVAGAGVLETIGYRMITASAPLQLYRVEVAAEEFLEMLGASLILYSVLLLCDLKTKANNIPIVIEESDVRAA